MTKHTEKEINDAIAVVQQALRDGRIQCNVAAKGRWTKAAAVRKCGYGVDYRAKPDPVEGWVHPFHIYKDIPKGASNPHPYIYVKQADSEVTDEG